MNIKPIHNDQDYKATLREVSRLMALDPDVGTPNGNKLDVLATLVQAFEAANYRIDAPDPIEAIKFRLDQSGLGVKDLQPMIGQSNRVYEVLNRKRNLTLPMIRRLHHGLGIPPAALIAEYA